MNDPHIVALLYRVKHGEYVDYSEAEPLLLEEPTFRLEVKDGQVRFELKDHYTTEEEAREAIEEYIRAWEFHACLENGPDSFRLKFQKVEIVDRNPTPDVIDLSLISLTGEAGQLSAKLTLGFRNFPSPPSGINYGDPKVQRMYQRYMSYRRREELLTVMAYFCLTVLEDSTGKSKNRRASSARKYQIAKSVLDKIAYLSSKRGGTEARKATGVDTDMTQQERRFLEEATKIMIRRAAEKGHDPDADLPKISLAELPQI